MHILLIISFAVLPGFLAYGLALVVADLRRVISTRERRAVEDNLAVLFGTQTEGHRKEVARDYFRVQFCRMADEARLVRGMNEMAPWIEVHGLELLKDGLRKGKGAVGVGAHFGSQKICFAYIADQGVPVTLFVRWTSGPKSSTDRLMRVLTHVPLARSMKRRPISVGSDRSEGEFGGGVRALGALRANEMVASAFDDRPFVDESKETIKLRLLGGDIQILPGLAVLAKAAGSPLFLVLSHISKGWRRRVMEIYPPISTEGEVEEIYGRCIAILEREVRMYPSHWTSLVVPGAAGRPHRVAWSMEATLPSGPLPPLSGERSLYP